jgi:hypothetical protein
MAITRIVDTDDSGTGTTGTPHNNAWLQSIYDSIETTWATDTYTPTFAGLTTGNGSVSGRYMQIGKFVWFRASFTFGSSSSMAASCTVSYPVTAENSNDAGSMLHGMIRDATGPTYYAVQAIPSSTTVAQIVAPVATGTYVSLSGIGTAVPITWATGDILEISGIYRAA